MLTTNKLAPSARNRLLFQFKYLSHLGQAYISVRAITLGLSLIFATWYSHLLGPNNRGLMAFVMVTNTSFSIITLSSFSLHTRLEASSKKFTLNLSPFVLVSLVICFFAPLFQTIFLLLFSYFSGIQIPFNVFFVSLLYAFFATMNFGLSDSLFAANEIRFATSVQAFTIIIQLAAFLSFYFSREASVYVAVLSAISISYLAANVSILTLLLSRKLVDNHLPTSVVRLYFSNSREKYFIVMLEQFIERIDKIALGFFGQTILLAQYTVNQSFISVFRFLADSINRLNINDVKLQLRSRNRFAAYALSLVTVLALALYASLLCYLVMGAKWQLPFLVVFAIAFIEFIRAILWIQLNHKLKEGFDHSRLNTVAFAVLLMNIILVYTLVSFYGLVGALIANIVAVLFAVFVIKRT